MKSFKEKVLEYARKITAKEKDKYSIGSKNQYYEFDDARQDLESYFEGNGATYREEVIALRKENRELRDRLYGRGR